MYGGKDRRKTIAYMRRKGVTMTDEYTWYEKNFLTDKNYLVLYNIAWPKDLLMN